MKSIIEELEKIEKQARVHKIKISDLCAKLIGCRVEADVQVKGESTQKAIPKVVELCCKVCGYRETLNYSMLEEEEKAVFLASLVFGKGEGLAVLAKNQICKRGPHKFRVQPVDYMDFAVLFVCDLLDPLVRFESRVYQTKKIYLVGQRVPYAKKITIHGRVYLEPSTRNITIIAEKAEPYEDEISNFEVTEEDKEAWIKYFMDRDPAELRSQVAPGMVGRPIVQESLLLTLHSVAIIPDIYGQPIRGCLRVIFFGDTKTYKSRSAKDLTINHYGLGDYVVGESSSRTGITYTIDSDNNALIWGVLPLNDLGFLVIDGMHSLHKEEWRETREALESQRVVVRRKLSGEALARTRVLGIINPGMRDHKPLNTYMFKCQALRDTYIFSDPPDITRWDFFIPFSRGDVPEADIAEAKPVERPIPDSVFVRHVFWAWSRKPEHIVYTEEAKEKIKQEAKRFMEKYAIDDIPVVHLGYREVIARVSVAYAALMHSTDENHEKVIVKKVHVEKAAAFLEKLAQLLELDEYKLEREGKLRIVKEELEEIINDLDSIALKILDLIKSEPKSSRELSEALDVDEKTIKRRYATLLKHQLVETAPGRGVSLTPRGILFLKEYIRDLGTVSVPNKEEMGTKSVPMSLGDTLRELKNWMLQNVDQDGLIDADNLSKKIRELREDPQRIVGFLLKEGIIQESPRLGKWIVKR